jgi:hypothetical protein
LDLGLPYNARICCDFLFNSRLNVFQFFAVFFFSPEAAPAVASDQDSSSGGGIWEVNDNG